jgi:hypothetical protein
MREGGGSTIKSGMWDQKLLLLAEMGNASFVASASFTAGSALLDRPNLSTCKVYDVVMTDDARAGMSSVKSHAHRNGRMSGGVASEGETRRH